MNKITQKKSKGFTLVELMIAVTIIGILTAIVYPNYVEQVRKSKRKDAIYSLTDIANRMERFYAENNTYIIADLDAIGLDAANPVSPDGMYKLTVEDASAVYYKAVAIPITGKPQAADSKCTKFTIDSRDSRTATGTLGIKCWR